MEIRVVLKQAWLDPECRERRPKYFASARSVRGEQDSPAERFREFHQVRGH